MGLLTQGTPMHWKDIQQHAQFIRKEGIKQFIRLYKKCKDRRDECLKWGDEVEFMLIRFDNEKRKVDLLLKARQILEIMDDREAKEAADRQALWRPEFGSYMVEGTPGQPYGACKNGGWCHEGKSTWTLLDDLCCIESNMKLRRDEVQSMLLANEHIVSLTSFPRLGCPDSIYPPTTFKPSETVTGSLFLPDQVIFDGHPRFLTLVRNIRSRRGRKVVINLPVFKDVKTEDPFIDDTVKEEDDFNGEARAALKADHVYMDAMTFGMGCCCLQVTFQASNLDEALTLYDQLTPLCPLMMALSAASPVHKGFLTDRDCRWAVISQAVDDRTRQELGEEAICPSENVRRIPKSRYDSIDSYLGASSSCYNDIPLVYGEDDLKLLLDSGVPESLARHVAHLFIRDPLALYREKLDHSIASSRNNADGQSDNDQDDDDTDHFENIQSTNWQTMRLKPPPSFDSPIGWRVEFRPMEVQVTDYENAAYVAFVVLMTRLILTYKLNLLIPISKVDENLLEAQKRDSAKRSRFWFRREIFGTSDSTVILMTADEIINGTAEFQGLVPLLRSYLLTADIEATTQCVINGYLNLISNRASGSTPTTAAWMRSYIEKHPHYHQDSRVGQEVCYDLLQKLSVDHTMPWLQQQAQG